MKSTVRNSKKNELYVHIPSAVARMLGLEYGNTVKWIVLEDPEGKRLAAIKKWR